MARFTLAAILIAEFLFCQLEIQLGKKKCKMKGEIVSVRQRLISSF